MYRAFFCGPLLLVFLLMNATVTGTPTLRFGVDRALSFGGDAGGLAAADGEGGFWVAVHVTRAGLPVSAGAVQLDYVGDVCASPGGVGTSPSRPCLDVYLRHVDAQGSLLYATYAGGAGDQQIVDLQVDEAGNALLSLLYEPLRQPTQATLEPLPLRGYRNPARLLMKFHASKPGLLFAREVGGFDGPIVALPGGGTLLASGQQGLELARLGPDGALDLRLPLLQGVDGRNQRMKMGRDGTVYLAGRASSRDLPAILPDGLGVRTFGDKIPTSVAYLLRVQLDPLGVLSGFASGATTGEGIRDFAPLPDGDVIVVGDLADVDRSGTSGSASTLAFGSTDAFAARLPADLGSLRWLSLLGGEGTDGFTQVVVDRGDRLLLVGRTTSNRFPLTPDALEPCAGVGSVHGVVTEISADGSTVHYASYLPSATWLQLLPGETSTGWMGAFVGNLADLAFYGAIQHEEEVPPGLLLANLDPQRAPRQARLCAVNAASFGRAQLSAGGVVTLFGDSLGPKDGVSGDPGEGQRYPTELAGTQVLVNGRPAPLLYVSDRQVNFWLPADTADAAQFTVTTTQNGTQSTHENLRAQAPGIFLDAFALRAAAWNGNGTKNTGADPAPPGALLSLFGTGFGATEPPLPADGALTNDAYLVRAPVRVWLDGVEAAVVRAGQKMDAPAGVTEIVIRIPAGLRTTTPVVELGAPSSDRKGIFVHVTNP